MALVFTERSTVKNGVHRLEATDGVLRILVLVSKETVSTVGWDGVKRQAHDKYNRHGVVEGILTVLASDFDHMCRDVN